MLSVRLELFESRANDSGDMLRSLLFSLPQYPAHLQFEANCCPGRVPAHLPLCCAALRNRYNLDAIAEISDMKHLKVEHQLTLPTGAMCYSATADALVTRGPILAWHQVAMN